MAMKSESTVTIERCATVAEALDSITSLAELEAFAVRLKGEGAKPATDEECRRIAQMKIQFQRGAR